jgi:hypothetical protein
MYKTEMILKIKFGIKKYSQVFNRVSTVYSGLKNFILVNQDHDDNGDDNDSNNSNNNNNNKYKIYFNFVSILCSAGI